MRRNDQVVKQLVIDLFNAKDAKEMMMMLDVPFYDGLKKEHKVITNQNELLKSELISETKRRAPKIEEFHFIVWNRSKGGVDLRIEPKGVFRKKEARERYIAALKKKQKHFDAVLKDGDYIVALVHGRDIDLILVGLREGGLKVVGASD